VTERYEVVRPKPQRSGPALPLIFGVFLIIAVIFYFFKDQDITSNSSIKQVETTSLELSDQNPDSLQEQSLDELIVEHQSIIKELEKAHNEALEVSSATTLRLEGDVSDLIDEVQTLKNELEVKRSVTEMMAEQITALMGKIPSQTPNEESPAKPRRAQVVDEAPTEPEAVIKIETAVTLTNYKLISSSPPKYPRRALDRGRSGSAIIKYTITQSGSVTNLEIIDERPRAYGFGESSLLAAESLKYTPSTKNGSPVASYGVTKKYVFNIE
jgi:TonB family protein|tara:strand:- start:98 stop:907 length:810 start_codon:yes stop_codon:yes gene_type:complete